MSKECWCGKTHPRGSIFNGEVRHFVMNWKLYQLRAKDAEEKGKEAPPAPVAVASG